MNTNGQATERSVPRWVGEAAADAQPSASERQVLGEVLAAMRRIRHGTIQLVVQDAKVVQIDTTEKKRL
jgi:hypothetical protein